MRLSLNLELLNKLILYVSFLLSFWFIDLFLTCLLMNCNIELFSAFLLTSSLLDSSLFFDEDDEELSDFDFEISFSLISDFLYYFIQII